MYKLQKSQISTAIAHLSAHGDTDVFPHLAELSFYAAEAEAVASELSGLDLDTYSPGGSIEALAPKGQYSFRIAHQLSALDNALFLAAVSTIGEKIEAQRLPLALPAAFSYRWAPAKGGSVFLPTRTYKDWLAAQAELLSNNLKIKRVISTDISDFYARVNFHRLENLLDEAAPGDGAAKFVKRYVKSIRAKQSFGLPVGGAAARLLAELSLSDTDRVLADHGIMATRFVDDFRLFLTAHQDPYDTLASLAQHLGINEGLSLNAAKTKVWDRHGYSERLKHLTTDVSDEAEGLAIDVLTSSVYFDDEPDPDEISQLKGVNLINLLSEELSSEFPDYGRVRVFFRALRIATPPEACGFVEKNFEELLVFSKDLVLLMDALHGEFESPFASMTKTVLDAVLGASATSVQLVRSWLLELFVRGVVPISVAQAATLNGLPSVMDKRQLLLIRGRIKDKNFFRSQKTNIASFSPAEYPCLAAASSCLPKDEDETWLGVLKAHYTQPTGAAFIKWAEKNWPDTIDKVIQPTVGVSEVAAEAQASE